MEIQKNLTVFYTFTDVSNLQIAGTPLEGVEEFCYLGSVITKNLPVSS